MRAVCFILLLSGRTHCSVSTQHFPLILLWSHFTIDPAISAKKTLQVHNTIFIGSKLHLRICRRGRDPWGKNSRAQGCISEGVVTGIIDKYGKQKEEGNKAHTGSEDYNKAWACRKEVRQDHRRSKKERMNILKSNIPLLIHKVIRS